MCFYYYRDLTVRLSLNMKKYLVLLLIFVLYRPREYNCGVFCTNPNGLQSSVSLKFKHPYEYNYHNVRFEREIKKTEFNINSTDLTEGSRVSRGVSKSKHLRLGDAHQIANYFLTGGPLKGHNHFTRASDCDLNNTQDNVGMSNIQSENSTDSSVSKETVNTNASDPIIGAVHIRSPKPLPLIPHAPLPHIPLPHVPLPHSLLGHILHPRFIPHINRLHSIPSALLKAASMPVHGLLQAQSHLHNILRPNGLSGGSNMLGSTNNVAQSHPQPTGYIVRYVPHNKKSKSLFPTVDTPQETSDSVNNN